jgi:chromosome segregation ATPase
MCRASFTVVFGDAVFIPCPHTVNSLHDIAGKSVSVDEVQKLKHELESHVQREEQLEEELLLARENNLLTSEHLEESLQQLDYLKVEMEATEEGAETVSQVALLHAQRTELANRVRKLVTVNGKLRSASTTMRHQIERKDKRIETLEKQVAMVKDESAVSEVVLQRQLREWQNRTGLLEQQLRDCQRTLSSTRKHTARHNTEWLQQRLEELKDENSTLHKQQDSQKYSWTHEKSLMKRTVLLLEEKVAELECQLIPAGSKGGLVRKVSIGKDPGTADMASSEIFEDVNLNHSSVHSSNHGAPNGHVAVAPLDLPSVALLQDRLQQVECRLKETETREVLQAEAMLELRHRAAKANSEVRFAQERAELLKSYLNVSLSNQPSKDKELFETLSQSVAMLERRYETENHQREQTERLQHRLLQEKLDLSARQKARIERVRDIDICLTLSRSQTTLSESLPGNERQIVNTEDDISLEASKRHGAAESAITIDRSSEGTHSLPISGTELARGQTGKDSQTLEILVDSLEKRCKELSEDNLTFIKLSSERNEVILSLQDRLASATQEVNEVQGKLETLNARASELDLEVKAAEAKHIELNDSWQKEKAALYEERATLHNRLAVSDKETAQSAEKMARLEVELQGIIEELKSQNTSLSEQMRLLSDQVESKSLEVIHLKDDEAELRITLQSKLELLADFQTELERVSGAMSKLSSELEAANDALACEQSARLQATEELSRLQEDLHAAKEALTTQERTSASLRSVSDLNASLKEQLDDKTVELEKMRTRVTDLETETVRLHQACIDKDSLFQEASARAGEVASLAKEREELSAQIMKQQQRLDSALAQFNEMEGVLRAAEEKLKASEHHAEALEEELYAIRGDHASALNRSRELDEQIIALENEKVEIEQKLEGDLEDAKRTLLSRLDYMEQVLLSRFQSDEDRISAETSKLSSELQHAMEALASEQSALRHATGELSRLQDDLQAAQEALQAHERTSDSLKSVSDVNATLKQQLDERTVERDNMQARVTDLEIQTARLHQVCIENESLLQKTNANRECEVVSIAKERDELSAQVNQTLESAMSRFRDIEGVLAVSEEHRTSIKEELHAIRNDHATALDKCRELDEQIIVLNHEKFEIEQKLEGDLEDAKRTLVRRLGDMEQAILSRLQSERERGSAEMSKLSIELQAATEAFASEQSALRHATGELSRLQDDLQAAQEALQAHERTSDTLKLANDANATLKQQLAEKKTELDDMRTQAIAQETQTARLQQACIDKEAMMQESILRSEATEAKLQEKLTHITLLEAAAKTRDDENIVIKNIDEETFNQLNELENQVIRLKGEVVSLENERDELSAIRGDHASSLERCRELDEQIITLKNEKVMIEQKSLGDLEDARATWARRLDDVGRELSASQQQVKTAEVASSALKKELNYLQDECNTLRVERDDLRKQLSDVRSELEIVRVKFADQERAMDAAVVGAAEEANASMIRFKELEVTLQAIQTEYHLIVADRNRLECQSNELQGKLVNSEAKHSDLCNHMDSVQTRYNEDITTSALQIKELDRKLQVLQAEHQALAREKDTLQENLRVTEGELAITKSKISEQQADLESVSRVKELDDTLRKLLKDHTVVLNERDSTRTELDAERREREAMEQNLLGQIKDAEFQFLQRRVEFESMISAANIRSEVLNDEVNTLRSALALVDQGNRRYQERLVRTEVEMKNSVELLDQTKELLREATEEKAALARMLYGVPGDVAGNDSLRARELPGAERE